MPWAPNPFALPEHDRADIALVGAWWHQELVARYPDDAVAALRRLEDVADTTIGLDGSDHFALGLSPPALERLACVLKFQGIYHDRDLYNYEVGPQYPGAIWTQKVRRRRTAYRSSDLEKLRLSVPCFLVDVPALRRRARALEQGPAATRARRMSPAERVGRDIADVLIERAVSSLAGVEARPHEVHCVLALSHAQRVDALRRLRGFSGERGVVRSRAALGRAAGGLPSVSTPESEWGELVRAAAPFLREPVGRARYLLQLCRHKVAVAPTGYGEVGLRHADAWRAGAALVSQDLSHVEMMLRVGDGENAAFCRPDLSDLRAVVRNLLNDGAARRRIARNGRRAYREWTSDWKAHLDTGIAAHIRRAAVGG